MAEIAQNSSYNRAFLLVSNADHLTGLTGATPTVVISKAGAAFASPVGAVSEIGDGWYNLALTAADTNTIGDLVLHATATGSDPTDIVDQIQLSATIAASTTITTVGGGAAPRGTLLSYRQRAGQMAGFHWFGSTTSAGAADGSSIVCSTWQSTELEDTYLKDTWYYVPSTQEARRIREHGLANASGTISPDRPHAAQIGSNVPFEIYGILPPIKIEGRLGLNDIVNRALAECWTLQKINIAAVQDAREYQIGAVLPWLETEDQIAEVYYRPANAAATDDDLVMPRWRFVPGGDNPRLEIGTPLNAGDTVKPMLYVPMSWWINSSGSWGLATTEGLQNETDGALLDLEGFEMIAAWYIYSERAKWGEQDRQEEYMKLAAQQRAAANYWKRISLHYFDPGREDHWDSLVTVTSTYRYEFQVLSRG